MPEEKNKAIWILYINLRVTNPGCCCCVKRSELILRFWKFTNHQAWKSTNTWAQNPWVSKATDNLILKYHQSLGSPQAQDLKSQQYPSWKSPPWKTPLPRNLYKACLALHSLLQSLPLTCIFPHKSLLWGLFWSVVFVIFLPPACWDTFPFRVAPLTLGKMFR